MTAVSVAMFFPSGESSAKKKPVYKDKNAPVEERVEDLLGRMTLREKVLQLQNRGTGGPGEASKVFNGESVGTVHEMSRNAYDCSVIYRDLQEYMKKETRLGIPVLTGVEGIQGIIQEGCTLFPHALAQGSTFNPELVERMTYACGSEAEVIGVHQILSPVLDIARDPRWGRVEETFGEDPYLIAEMGIAYVNGYQKHRITCMPKHFVAHGTPTGGLNCAVVHGGERDLRGMYLYPFARVIEEAEPLAIMSCYSSYDGVPVTGSRYYMTDILRGELGFNGYVYSDWGSVERLKSFHHIARDNDEAGRLALKAGIDLNIDSCYDNLEKQVEEGLVDVADIDNAVRRILYVKFALGIFDEPNGDPEKVKDVVRCPEHVALAKEVADESAVLLQNNGILPLDLEKYDRIAVLGPNSNQTVFGDYSWTTPYTKEGVTLYQGLKNVIGDKVELVQEDGCDWWSQDDSGIAKAVEVAENCDLAIVAVGTRSTYLARNPDKSTSGEGYDLSSLELPGKQLELLKAVKKTGKPMVVVFLSGKPLVLSWLKDNADAILVQWYAGEQQGNSAADILAGNVNPSGRLNVSFPRSTGNIPCYYNYYPYYAVNREDFNQAGTYENPKSHYVFEEPFALWSFGYGLSYTDFDYVDFKVNKDVFSADNDKIVVEVDVRNTGDRAGKEVVQLYVRDMFASVVTPVKQLKAFRKVSIESGETETVRLEVPVKELFVINDRMERVVEPGEFEIQVGSSSDNILFRKVVEVK